MNLLVFKSDSTYCVRPDTTLERESAEFYIPDGCREVEVRKCIWSRITKAGKAVGEKFIPRYIDSCGEGYLLYCNGSPWVDGSSIIKPDTRPLDEASSAILGNALIEITRRTSVRIGDLLMVETSEPVILRPGDSFEYISLR